MSRTLKMITIISSAALLISACGSGDKTNDGKVSITPPVIEQPVEYSMNGVDIIQGKLDRDLQAFTIDFALVSGQANLETAYSETSPPMPFAVGDVSFYQEPDRYSAYLSRNETSLGGGQPLEWTRITIASDGYKTELYVNGNLTSSADHSTPLLTDTAVLIGKGFKERYWAGTLKYFDIYGSYITPEATQDIDTRLTGSRVFEIE